MNIQIPELEALSLEQHPFTDQWLGVMEHVGSSEKMTPFLQAVAGKTTCGTVALMSGIMIWGATRLRPFTETDFCFEIAEAAFAWHHDWRYLDVVQGPRGRAPADPAALSASMVLYRLLRRSVRNEDKWTSYFPPIQSALYMANVVRFILPDKKAKDAFDLWIKYASENLDELAPDPDIEEPVYSEFESDEAYNFYCAPCRGEPISPSALILPNKKINIKKEANAYLASLDPTKNRFLRSDLQMAELGFEGNAYE